MLEIHSDCVNGGPIFRFVGHCISILSVVANCVFEAYLLLYSILCTAQFFILCVDPMGVKGIPMFFVEGEDI